MHNLFSGLYQKIIAKYFDYTFAVSKFRGKNRQLPVISCALIVYSLGFWKDTFIELAEYSVTLLRQQIKKENIAFIDISHLP